MQRTAFGAADVPEVNNNAHRASTSQLAPLRPGGLPRRARSVRAASSAGPSVVPTGGRIVAVGEAIGDEHAAGQVDSLERRSELVPGGGVR